MEFYFVSSNLNETSTCDYFLWFILTVSEHSDDDDDDPVTDISILILEIMKVVIAMDEICHIRSLWRIIECDVVVLNCL